MEDALDLTYRDDYCGDEKLKTELIGFVDGIHRLNLTRWNEMGCWDSKYRPLSWFENNRIVSSVCVYSMDMVVNGRRCQVAQISAVGTLEEYRGRGLSKALTEKAIEWARPNHDFFYLFANEEAIPFYRNRGFRPVDEYQTVVFRKGVKPRPGITKLDVSDPNHFEIIREIAFAREPASDKLGVYNPKLFLFWCLYYLKDCVYLIPELDCLVLLKNDGQTQTIFDIASRYKPDFATIYPYLTDGTDRRLEFMFMTDRLNLGPHEPTLLSAGNGTHLLGNTPIDGEKLIFPYTAHA